jgi:hypothetical protein
MSIRSTNVALAGNKSISETNEKSKSHYSLTFISNKSG